jgi:hypothetical protein
MRNPKAPLAHRGLTLTRPLVIICALSFAVAAQTTSATDGSTPLGLQPGASGRLIRPQRL